MSGVKREDAVRALEAEMTKVRVAAEKHGIDSEQFNDALARTFSFQQALSDIDREEQATLERAPK